MATATLTFYRTSISKGKAPDNIEDYLNGLSSSNKFTIQNADHFEHSYKPDKLRVALDQYKSDQWSNAYDYLKVKNSDEGQSFYYFLSNPTADAKKTISFDLEMDVISTWSYLFKANFKDTTRIIRQHEDRFASFYNFNWKGQMFDEDISMGTYTVRHTNMDLLTLDAYALDSLEVRYTFWPEECESNVSIDYTLIEDSQHNLTGEVEFEVVDMYSQGDIQIDFEFYVNLTEEWSLPVIVNEVSEGMGNLPKMKSVKSVIKDNDSDLKWYFILKSHGDTANNPLDVYLCANEDIDLQTYGTSDIDYTQLELGKYYYFTYVENNNAKVRLPWRDPDILGVSTTNNYYGVLVVNRHTDTGKLEFRLLEYNTNGEYVSGSSDPIVGSSWSTQGLTLAYVGTTSDLADINTIRALPTTYRLSGGVKSLPSISSWNQSDPQLINIIECPYCPIPCTVSNNVYTFGAAWRFDGFSRLHCDTNIPTLAHRLVNNEKFNFTRTVPEISIRRQNIPYSDYYEPKLMHSDYFTDKFTYDSFSIEIPYERLEYKPISGIFDHDYSLNAIYQQSPISSDLQFKITFGDNLTFKEMADFETILISNRNNLYPIFTDAYLNYMNTGYNYDKKNATRNYHEIVTGALGGIASGILGGVGAAKSKRGLGLTYGGNAVVSGATTIMSSILNIMETADNLQRKQEELRQQSATISGSNDLTLFSLNTNNKAIRYQYKVSDELKDELTALFHYYGYAKNRTGIPNINSRCRFNYIQCEPQFTAGLESNGVLTKYLPYIKQRFADGITFVHFYNDGYDMSCQYENWETWLV